MRRLDFSILLLLGAVNSVAVSIAVIHFGGPFNCPAMLFSGLVLVLISFLLCFALSLIIDRKRRAMRVIIYLSSLAPSWLYPLILSTNQADAYADAWPGVYSYTTHASLSPDVVRLPAPLGWDTRYGGAIHVQMSKSTADNIIKSKGYQHVSIEQELAIRHIPEPAVHAFGNDTELYVIDDHKGEITTLITNADHTEAIFRVEDVQNPVGPDDDRNK